MLDTLREVFASEFFMPHGHCYLWNPAMVWTQVLSNGAIALSYVAISATLAYLVRSVRDLPFKFIYVAFGLFIVTCGFTHIMDVVVIWKPQYWLDGSLRAVTAIASVGTAFMLPPLIPKAIALARGAKAAHDKGIELETVVKDLGSMYEKTKELEALKSQFFANVSHELRTPLALILAPTSKLLSDPHITAEQRESLEVVARNARLLLRQVNELLDVAKAEAGKMDVEYVNADLAGLVRMNAAEFQTLASDRKISYSIQTPKVLPVQIDPQKLQRILLNLLSNAFKFTPDGGAIRCQVDVWEPVAGGNTGPRAVVEVADSGPGVPRQYRQAIFERFRQLEGGTTRRFAGTGLGLTIAREFTELHHGKIAVNDAPEGGALFRVEIPLVAPVGTKVKLSSDSPATSEGAQQMASELRAAPLTQKPATGEAQGLVLVVEDNTEMNNFLVATLSQSHRVATARNGAEALTIAQQLSPDLILTDVMMPEMGGDELLRQVKNSRELRDIPVVVLTAKTDDALSLKLLREGAQDYLTKPFSAEEVKARIYNLVSAKRARDLIQNELASKTTDLESLAQEITKEQRELKMALEALRVARDQALHSSEVKTNFLSLVSHELRTPLTGIRIQIDRLHRDETLSVTEKQKRILQKLDSASKRLEVMVESLLDYARLESGRLPVELQEVNVAGVIRDVLEEARPLAEEKQLLLLGPGAEDESLFPITTDPRLVRLIMTNLVGNAVKYTERGEISISVQETRGECRFSVSDTGLGIPREDQARIFEPFEQLELVRRKHTPGVGLGLALVRGMVEALGGTIALHSEVGRGSTFTVTLPNRSVESPQWSVNAPSADYRGRDRHS